LEGKYSIYLTRYDDVYVPLLRRSCLAKSLNANIYVSLHCNASTNGSRGIEVYTLNYFSKDSKLNIKESIALGMEVLDEANLKLKIENRGMKFANFQVLREIIPHCPTLLVETGFLTNEDEGNYFLIPEKIRGMALAIFKGIDNYLKSRL